MAQPDCKVLDLFRVPSTIGFFFCSKEFLNICFAHAGRSGPSAAAPAMAVAMGHSERAWGWPGTH